MKKLCTYIELEVRFSETDAMGVVWHGNYLKFFEDAREYFGKEFGLEYLRIHDMGYFVPIVKSSINHKASVYYGQRIRVNICLEQHPASKAIFNYEVINLATGEVAATGSTTQVFVSRDDRMMELAKPDFYVEWEEKQNWQ